ncbi:reverse transcriptase domain-containing protein, partial [Tanacetum coccineum]
MKSKHPRDDYLYYADHTAKLVQEQWTEPVEPLEWKTPESRLKPSSVEPPELELKELPEHLKYAFLQENNQILVVISSALSTDKKLDSSSPWVSHVQVVPKKGGMTTVKNKKDELILQRTVTRWRVCIDYLKLNNATRKDHFLLPFLDQMLERLAGHEYYCFLDGFSRYFKIPIAPKDQEKTTFTCLYGTFAFKRMPFGLCNAPATFQQCMTTIFHELIKDSMEVFMDDFSVFGIVLGHKVSGSGIEVDKAKIKVISKLPYPTNVKAIRSFLGHAGFYRRFVKDFSQIACPMTQLLVKDALFNFSKECIQAFDTLKHKLTQAPIMIKPDWSLPFEIMCNASDYAVGAVLGQRIDKHFKPIHYTNKTMNKAQENYITTEKELLAVVYAFDKSRQYLVLS